MYISIYTHIHITHSPYLPPFLVESLSATIDNSGYQTVSLGSKILFKFYVTEALSAGDSIKFSLPEGFSFVEPTCFHKNSGSYATAEVLFNNRYVICKSFQYALGTSTQHMVDIIGVTNPNRAGYFEPFVIETYSGLTPKVIEQITVPGPYEVLPGSISIIRNSAGILRTQNTTHQLDIIFAKNA